MTTLYDAVILAETALQGYWKCDEAALSTTLVDSKNGNTASLNGGTTCGVASLTNLGTSVQLDGTSGYISIPTSSAISPTTALTVECWFKITTFGSDYEMIFCKPTDNTSVGLFGDWFVFLDKLSTPQWKLNVGIMTGGTGRSISTSVSPTAGVTNHLALTYDGTTVRLYFNGLQIGSTAATGSIAASGQPLHFGLQNGAKSYFAPAVYNKLAIYNAALSANDILNHYILGVIPLSFGAFAIDGYVQSAPVGGSSQSVSLTTVQANDIVLVCFYTDTITGVGSSVSSTHLTGLKRAGLPFVSSGRRMEIWWALATSALTNESITITLSTTNTNWCIQVFAVNGPNTVTPWDANGSIPATSVVGNGVSPSASSLSTTSATDLLIACFGDNINGSNFGDPGNVPSGFTTLATLANTNGGEPIQMGIGLKSVTSIQSGVTVTWGAVNGFGPSMIVDALTANAPSVSPSLLLPMMGVG